MPQYGVNYSWLAVLCWTPALRRLRNQGTVPELAQVVLVSSFETFLRQT